MAVSQLNLDIKNHLCGELFAGFGGFAEAYFQATGLSPDVAINHSDNAISVHTINHPQTEHYITDIFDVDPKLALKGRPLGHLHLSPDCTHFSQAAGGQPRDTKIRSLSWVGVKWIGQAKPLTVTLENVLSILTWGPLIAKRDKATGLVIKKDGSFASRGEVVPRNEQFLIPDPKRKGKTWKRFISIIKSYGYEVDWKSLRGADYGGHTTRDRLFMAARRDGESVTFPSPTHFKKPARGQKSG